MLRVAKLSLRYPGAATSLLEDISFELRPGELLWLCGPNGCGKTSLLNCLSGVIPQRVSASVTGSCSLNGQDLAPIPLTERFRLLAYQMSDPGAQLFFPRVRKELSFALENLGLPRERILSRISYWTEFFELDALLAREPATLSFGEQKLLLCAVCASMEAPLLLLEEALSGLSDMSRERVLAWLKLSLGEGKMVVATEHSRGLELLATCNLDLG